MLTHCLHPDLTPDTVMWKNIRTIYVKIVKKLTSPLFKAYQQMRTVTYSPRTTVSTTATPRTNPNTEEMTADREHPSLLC